MRLFDRFKKGPTGFFTLEVRERKSGKLIECFQEKNLVVIGSQPTHAALLGGNVSNNSVTKMGFGTNGTAPVFGNTTLTGQYVNAIVSTTYPVSNEVSFQFQLGNTDAGADGMAISEFGLLTTAGVLYARKVRATPLNFNSDISLTGSWIISF
jgi:hypothetical protein